MLVESSKYPEIANIGFHEILAGNAATRKFVADICNNKQGDFSDFVILNRMFYTALCAFTGENIDEKHVTISNITGPENLLTEKQVKTNKLPSTWKDTVFSFGNADRKSIKHFSSVKVKGKYPYQLEKEDVSSTSNKVPYFLTDAFSNSYMSLDHTVLSIKNVIKTNYYDKTPYIDFTKLAKRLNLTCKFGTECDTLPSDLSCYARILDGFKLREIIPLVGTLRGNNFGRCTVAHFLCGIDIPNADKKLDLKNLIPKLDHHVPYLLYENYNLHGHVSECSDLDIGRTDGYCCTCKLIVRRKDENRIYVLYVAVFTRDLIRSKHRKNLVVQEYKEHFETNGFEVCLDYSMKNKDDSIPYTMFKINKNPKGRKGTAASGTIAASSLLFVAMNGNQTVFASSDGTIRSELILNMEEHLFEIGDSQSQFMRYYPLDDNSAVAVMGKMNHTQEEYALLSNAMDQAGIPADNGFVSSVVGNSFNGACYSKDDDDSLDEDDGDDSTGGSDVQESPDLYVPHDSPIPDVYTPIPEKISAVSDSLLNSGSAEPVTSNGSSIFPSMDPSSHIVVTSKSVAAAETTITGSSSAAAIGLKSTALGLSSTSILSAKPILASIVATMLVTSGTYIVEPELFGMNPNVDGISNIPVKSGISSEGNSDTGTISRNNLSSDGVSTLSSSGIFVDSPDAVPDVDSPDAVPDVDSPDAVPDVDSPDALSQVSSLISDSEIIQPDIFDNPVYDVFTDAIHATDIAFDSKDNLYATDKNDHSVKVYDSSGSIVKTIGKSSIIPVSFEFPGFEGMSKLSSLFVQYAHAAEEILYCSIQSKYGCTDPDGMGPLESGDGQFFNPTGW